MKRIPSAVSTAVAAALVAGGALVSSSAAASSAPRADFAIASSVADRATTVERQPRGRTRDFDGFLDRYQAANSAFLNGDSDPWLEITAGRDPVSIFGGFGGLGEHGLDEVHQRYLLAARAFQPSGAAVDIDYLVKDVRGRLGYTVAIETADVLYSNTNDVHHQVLRVTMVFRYEDGGWKIVHRHADDMVDLQLP